MPRVSSATDTLTVYGTPVRLGSSGKTRDRCNARIPELEDISRAGSTAIERRTDNDLSGVEPDARAKLVARGVVGGDQLVELANRRRPIDPNS